MLIRHFCISHSTRVRACFFFSEGRSSHSTEADASGLILFTTSIASGKRKFEEYLDKLVLCKTEYQFLRKIDIRSVECFILRKLLLNLERENCLSSGTL